MNCFISSLDDAYFSQSKLNECQNAIRNFNYDPLKYACKSFTSQNLRGSNEKIARDWNTLFHCYFDQISEEDLNKSINNFKTKFPKLNFEVIYLTDIIDLLKRNIATEKSRNYLVNKGCVYFNENNIKKIDRNIALNWIEIFERFHAQLNFEQLGAAASTFIQFFGVKAEELKVYVDVICFDRQTYKFPLLLLLTREVFLKQLKINKITLHLENFHLAVVRVFNIFFYSKQISRDTLNMSAYSLVQLLDLARMSQDTVLIQQCLEKLESQSHELSLKNSSKAAIEGEKALKYDDAKKLYRSAVKDCPTDFLSYEALAKVAFQKKKYKQAILYFYSALQSAPFKNELYISQVTALSGYCRELELNRKQLILKLSQFIKKFIYKEFEFPSLSQFSRQLEQYFVKNIEIIQMFDIRPPNLNFDFTLDGITQLKEDLEKVFAKIKENILELALTYIEKIPLEQTKNFEFCILKAEIYLAMEDYNKLADTFEFMEKLALAINPQQKVQLNLILAKLYLACEQTEDAKEVLIEAHKLDRDNEEINRLLVLYGYESEDLDINQFKDDKEIEYYLGLRYFLKKDLVNAKKHLLNSDSRQSQVNYFLGLISNKKHYFSLAIKTALIDMLEWSRFEEIARYFLAEGSTGNLIETIEHFLVTDFYSTESEAIQLLSQLVEKVNDPDLTEKVKLKMVDSSYSENKVIQEYHNDSSHKQIGYLQSKLMSLEKRDKAEMKMTLKNLLEFFPTSLEIKKHLGKIYFEEEKFTKAIPYLKDGNSADMILLYGKILIKQGEFQLAEEVLNKGVILDDGLEMAKTYMEAANNLW